MNRTVCVLQGMKLYFKANLKLTNSKKIQVTYEAIKTSVNANKLKTLAKMC